MRRTLFAHTLPLFLLAGCATMLLAYRKRGSFARVRASREA